MDWSPDGSKIIFNAGGTGASGTNLMKTIPAASGTATTIASVATNGELRNPTYRTARSVNNWDQLLSRYAPRLQYDHFETYYADSAAGVTDLAPANKVTRDSTVLAGHGLPGIPELYLDYLGDLAPSSLTTDDIDESNSNPSPSEDSTLIHLDGGYGNRMFGRAVQDSTGKWWIQYWLWYYYNFLPDSPGIGDHEGDWEMMQVGFTSGGVPDTVTFAQHGDGMRCTWDQANRYFTGTIPGASGPTVSPIGYVAAGTHATYPRAGTWVGSTVHPLPDYSRGDDSVNSVIPTTDSITSVPSFLQWKGQWGGSGNSPVGPRFQTNNKWADPGLWSAGVNACDTNPGGFGFAAGQRRGVRRLSQRAVRRLAPATPFLSVTATTRAVVARYAMPERVRSGTRIAAVLEASDGTKTVRHVTARRRGTLRLGWPSSERAGVVFVNAVSARRIPGTTVRRTVRAEWRSSSSSNLRP